MTDIMEPSYQTGPDPFSSEYWRAEAERWKQSYDAIRLELEEYTAGSADLERELDHELSQCKQRITGLQRDVTALTEANRSLKVECQKCEKRNVQLEEQIQQCTTQRQSLLLQRRKLEQTNDEMETSQRILTASLVDQTRRVEQLIEAKALLESELEQTRRQQKETEQRLRDELKDSRDENVASVKSAGATRLSEAPDNGGLQRVLPADGYRIIDPDNEAAIRNSTLATGYYSLDFSSNELILPKLRDRTSFVASGAKNCEFGICDNSGLIQRVNELRIKDVCSRSS